MEGKEERKKEWKKNKEEEEQENDIFPHNCEVGCIIPLIATLYILSQNDSLPLFHFKSYN